MADRIIELPNARCTQVQQPSRRGRLPREVVSLPAVRRRKQQAAHRREQAVSAVAERQAQEKHREFRRRLAAVFAEQLSLGASDSIEGYSFIIKLKGLPPKHGFMGIYRDDPELLLAEIAVMQDKVVNWVRDLREGDEEE